MSGSDPSAFPGQPAPDPNADTVIYHSPFAVKLIETMSVQGRHPDNEDLAFWYEVAGATTGTPGARQFVMGVVDGMGSPPHGDLAAQIVADAIRQNPPEGEEPFDWMNRVFDLGSEQIRAQMRILQGSIGVLRDTILADATSQVANPRLLMAEIAELVERADESSDLQQAVFALDATVIAAELTKKITALGTAGATVVLALAREIAPNSWHFFVGNAGDPKGYLFHGGRLTYMTVEHTLFGKRARAAGRRESDLSSQAGQSERRLRNKDSRTVYSYLGGGDPGIRDFREQVVNGPFAFVLCTDGIWKSRRVNDVVIADAIRSCTSGQQLCEELIGASSGDDDDRTCLVMWIH